MDNWWISSEDWFFYIFKSRWLWLSSVEDRGLDMNVLVLLLCGSRGRLSLGFGGCWNLTI